MTAITLSFRLMAMVCHSSYPRNSDIASPPGTFAVYLSCAETAQPKTASHTIAIPSVSFLVGVIAAPHASRALVRLTSRRGLDDSSSEVALEIAIDVQTKLLESGCPRERPRAFERPIEIHEGRRQLGVWRQGDWIDV